MGWVRAGLEGGAGWTWMISPLPLRRSAGWYALDCNMCLRSSSR